MFFANQRPASAVMRSNDAMVVRAWAAPWPDTVLLHRRIVVERSDGSIMIGPWVSHDRIVDVELDTPCEVTA